jgi:hypothetical protein
MERKKFAVYFRKNDGTKRADRDGGTISREEVVIVLKSSKAEFVGEIGAGGVYEIATGASVLVPHRLNGYSFEIVADSKSQFYSARRKISSLFEKERILKGIQE